MTFTSFIKKARYKIALVLTKFFDKALPEIYRIYQQKHSDSLLEDISQSAYIVSPLNTLEHVQHFIENNKSGAYMRFGDGDIFLASGKNDMLQKTNNSLLTEMREAFALRGDNVIKALAIHSDIYGKEKEMFIGNHLQSADTVKELMSHVFPFYTGYKIYSMAALHYAATYYPEKANQFLQLLKTKAVLFIGNGTISSSVISRLFGNIKHIKTPAKNSYDEIDRIETEAITELQKLTGFGVVVVSMGCSGRVLMKRLYKKNCNIFLFDFGSLLDGIAGNDSREWLKKVEIDYHTLLQNL